MTISHTRPSLFVFCLNITSSWSIYFHLHHSKNEEPDIFEKIINSNIIVLEPWFMGIAVTVLLVIIIATLLYTILCRSRKRRHSHEAILNMTEEQERAQLNPSCKKPCAIISLCAFLITLFVSVNFLVFHLRETGKTSQGNLTTWMSWVCFWLIFFCFGCSSWKSIFAWIYLVIILFKSSNSSN